MIIVNEDPAEYKYEFHLEYATLYFDDMQKRVTGTFVKDWHKASIDEDNLSDAIDQYAKELAHVYYVNNY